jgi:hypothetical protein
MVFFVSMLSPSHASSKLNPSRTKKDAPTASFATASATAKNFLISNVKTL